MFRAQKCEDAFESLKSTMQAELGRFHVERTERIFDVSENYFKAQLALVGELQRLYQSGLEEVQSARGRYEDERANTNANGGRTNSDAPNGLSGEEPVGLSDV